MAQILDTQSLKILEDYINNYIIDYPYLKTHNYAIIEHAIKLLHEQHNKCHYFTNKNSNLNMLARLTLNIYKKKYHIQSTPILGDIRKYIMDTIWLHIDNNIHLKYDYYLMVHDIEEYLHNESTKYGINIYTNYHINKTVQKFISIYNHKYMNIPYIVPNKNEILFAFNCLIEILNMYLDREFKHLAVYYDLINGDTVFLFFEEAYKYGISALSNKHLETLVQYILNWHQNKYLRGDMSNNGYIECHEQIYDNNYGIQKIYMPTEYPKIYAHSYASMKNLVDYDIYLYPIVVIV